MKTNSNEGLTKVYWTIFVCLLALVVIGAVLWWYDAYLLHEIKEVTR